MEQNQSTLIPINYQIFSELMSSPGNYIQPLSTTMQHQSADITELYVDTSHCNPDTVHVDCQNNQINIYATHELSFSENPNHTAPLIISRKVSTSIPLPNVINPELLQISNNDDHLLISIPLNKFNCA